jgi:hypothetical protein
VCLCTCGWGDIAKNQTVAAGIMSYTSTSVNTFYFYALNLAFSVSLHGRLPTVCLSSSQTDCLFDWLLSWILCLSVCLSVCLWPVLSRSVMFTKWPPFWLHACLPACLSVCLSVINPFVCLLESADSTLVSKVLVFLHLKRTIFNLLALRTRLQFKSIIWTGLKIKWRRFDRILHYDWNV